MRHSQAPEDPRQPLRPTAAATVGNIVGTYGAVWTRRRRAIVAAVVTMWVAFIGAEAAIIDTHANPSSHGLHSHATHLVDASTAVTVGHAHASQGETPLAPDTDTLAVLPRVTITVLLLVSLFVLSGFASLSQHRTVLASRGPPRATLTTLAGRDILARFCIARR